MASATPIISLVDSDDSDDDIVCTGMTPARPPRPRPAGGPRTLGAPRQRVLTSSNRYNELSGTSLKSLAVTDVEFLGSNHSPASAYRSRGKAVHAVRAANNTTAIDFEYLPHILDKIIAYSPDAALPLRAASSGMRNYIDRKLYRHVVLSARKPSKADDMVCAPSLGKESGLLYFSSAYGSGANLPGFGTHRADWWTAVQSFEHPDLQRFKQLADRTSSLQSQNHFGLRMDQPRDPLDLLSMHVDQDRIEFRASGRLLTLLKGVKVLDIYGMGKYSAHKGTFMSWLARHLSPDLQLRVYPDEHGRYYDCRVSFSTSNIVVFPSAHAIPIDRTAASGHPHYPPGPGPIAQQLHQAAQLLQHAVQMLTPATSDYTIPIRVRGKSNRTARITTHVNLGLLNNGQPFPLVLCGNKSTAADAYKHRLEGFEGVYIFTHAAPNLHQDAMGKAKACIQLRLAAPMRVSPKWKQFASHLALAIFRGVKCILVDYELVDQEWLEFAPGTTAANGLKQICDAVKRSLEDPSDGDNAWHLLPASAPRMSSNEAAVAVETNLICITGAEYKARVSRQDFETARMPERLMRLVREKSRNWCIAALDREIRLQQSRV
ncbi:hypothetical protein Q8F55_004564 [Vanrija albida]|uniref:F-box domain-containing protein n=1 Tax=Vanrija albida TaxID=181172 RepID=A0ABR3Q7X6_9TREE